MYEIAVTSRGEIFVSPSLNEHGPDSISGCGRSTTTVEYK